MVPFIHLQVESFFSVNAWENTLTDTSPGAPNLPGDFFNPVKLKIKINHYSRPRLKLGRKNQ